MPFIPRPEAVCYNKIKKGGTFMTRSEYNALPAEAVGTGSPIRLEVCETEVDLSLIHI